MHYFVCDLYDSTDIFWSKAIHYFWHKDTCFLELMAKKIMDFKKMSVELWNVYILSAPAYSEALR